MINMPYLIIVTEGLNKEPVTITLGNEGIIGREKSNNIYIEDPRASRQHAKITKESDGSFLLVDMGSRNGIIVNGEKVSRRKLIENDRIVIGRTTLVYNESVPASVRLPQQLAAPAEPLKITADDKTITADPLGRPVGEPAKLGSDALKKAIQDMASAHSADKTAAVTKKTALAGALSAVPPGAAIPKSAQASKTGTSDEVTDEEPTLGKRIIVFLAFLIFFVTILLFAKEITKRLLSKVEKSQPAQNIFSPENISDK